MRILWISEQKLDYKSSVFGALSPHSTVVHNFNDGFREIQENLIMYDFVFINVNPANILTIDDQIYNAFFQRYDADKEKIRDKIEYFFYTDLLGKKFPDNHIIFTYSDEIISKKESLHLSPIVKKLQKKIQTKTLYISDFDKIQNFTNNKIVTNRRSYFIEYFKEKMHKRPRIFYYRNNTEEVLPEEKNEQIVFFSAWIKENVTGDTSREVYEYLTLRRGLIDVIKDLLGDNDCIVTAEFKERNFNNVEFLKKLEESIEEIPASADIDKKYLSIIEILTKPFHFLRKGNLFYQTPADECINKIPLYFLRGWIAHEAMQNSKKTKITSSDVAFTFVLAIRCIFDKTFDYFIAYFELMEILLKDWRFYGLSGEASLRQYMDKLYDEIKIDYKIYSKGNIITLLQEIYKRGHNKAIEQNEDYMKNDYLSFAFLALYIGPQQMDSYDWIFWYLVAVPKLMRSYGIPPVKED